MPQQFHLPRILGFLAAIICTCVTLAVAAEVTPIAPADARNASGTIILDVAGSDDSPGQGQMPPVVFDHDRHTQGDQNGETCADCHEPGTQTFRPLAEKTGAEREDAYHTGCISCHTERQDKDIQSGPLQAECRACHNAATLSDAANAPARADGGFDASLHARHLASPAMTAPDGEVNCAACHHRVKHPVSPGLEADSCRSCHPDARREQNAGTSHRPPFADVAHKQCISCHQKLPSGEKPALTCAACHDAKTKAEYPKLSPLPRLEAGQPDAVMMEPPQPPENAPAPETRPDTASIPPVVFNHKQHEAVTENCTSCHHNTLQKCSTCHTPQGNPKGGNVTWPDAMHAPDSSRSCVGCHETRKTASPTCAGCHASMPRKAQPNCAACHQPLPGAADATGAAKEPSDALAAYAATHKILNERAKPSGPDLSQVPEKLVLGSLSEQFEPSTFPHRAIVEKLASGIRENAPGMLWFHAAPDALCGTCHHNTPPAGSPGTASPSAPPPCASCHARSAATDGAVSPGDVPPLKIAYHQQCMTCHTRMDVKPAATDCTGCHTLRHTPRTTEGGK